jgi:hypothetical protein
VALPALAVRGEFAVVQSVGLVVPYDLAFVSPEAVLGLIHAVVVLVAVASVASVASVATLLVVAVVLAVGVVLLDLRDHLGLAGGLLGALLALEAGPLLEALDGGLLALGALAGGLLVADALRAEVDVGAISLGEGHAGPVGGVVGVAGSTLPALVVGGDDAVGEGVRLLVVDDVALLAPVAVGRLRALVVLVLVVTLAALVALLVVALVVSLVLVLVLVLVVTLTLVIVLVVVLVVAVVVTLTVVKLLDSCRLVTLLRLSLSH